MKRQKLSRLTTALVLAVAAAAMTIAWQSSAATLYVSQTSANPSPLYSTRDTAAHTVQEAVDAASDGDTVLVAPGQYGLTNQITITKAITLQSTMGAGQTFLNSLDNIWCLAISNSLVIVDGFTLQNTSVYLNSAGVFLVGGTVQNCNFTNFPLVRLGASIFMTGGVLSNSIVTYHRVASEASAVYCSGGGLITDCQILGGGHGAGGVGVYLVGSQLRNSFILGAPGVPEMGEGAAVFAVSSAIEGCAVTHNFNTGPGGGAWLDTCLMDRCVVAYNVCAFPEGQNGGGGVSETNSIIRNSLIVSNSLIVGQPEFPFGGFGGGVYMRGGALVNCTVSENEAFNIPQRPGHGAGVYVESGGITNSIISSNFFSAFGSLATNQPDSEWFNVGAGVFDHSCTTPDPGGVGNIIQDPRFLDLADGNFHCASNSPCIGAGVVQPWMTNAFDLDGNPRTINGAVDIGAYQSPFATAPPPTPQRQAESLIGEVSNLFQQQALNRNQEKTLNARLKIAVDSMNEGRTATACAQVGAFINQVQTQLKRGALTQAQAQSLTDAANKLRASLGCQ